MWYKKGNRIALLVQRVMKERTAVRERVVLGSCESVVQPYLHYDWHMERFQVLASLAHDYSSLEQQTSLDYL